MWQLKHQGWARRFELDAVAIRFRSPRRPGRLTHAVVKSRSVLDKRTKTLAPFRAGIAHQLHTVVQNVKSKLARSTGHVKIVNGKLDKASLLVALAGDDLARENSAAWLADKLHFPLYRVSLDALMKEGRGETERILARVFTAAAKGDVVLYFEQADVLFGLGKNLTSDRIRVTNALLQHITLHRGLVLLAVSGRKKIDPMWVHYVDDFFDL